MVFDVGGGGGDGQDGGGGKTFPVCSGSMTPAVTLEFNGCHVFPTIDNIS